MKFKQAVYEATAITGRQGHDPPQEVPATYTQYTITIKGSYSHKKLCKGLKKLGIHVSKRRETDTHWIVTGISLKKISLKKINSVLYKKPGPPSTIAIDKLPITSTA